MADSICWVVAETDTQFTIFGLSAMKKQYPISDYNRHLMRTQRKAALSIILSIGIVFAPGCLFNNTSQSLLNDTLFYLLLMQNGTFGSVHHFIGSDHSSICPVQETSEK